MRCINLRTFYLLAVHLLIFSNEQVKIVKCTVSRKLVERNNSLLGQWT